MNREYLADDEWMLFVFDKPGIYSFWMKNTLIALDIIWLDEDYNIIYISSDTPPCKSDPCPWYWPKQSAQYVFEINGGLSQKLWIKTWDKFIYKD